MLIVSIQESAEWHYITLWHSQHQTANWLSISTSKSVLISYLFNPHVWSNNLVPSLGFTMHMFVLHVFLLVLGAHPGYLRSNAKHQLFRYLAFMIDFHLIAFWTYIDITPGDLSSILTKPWCSFKIYSHFLFDILLRVFFTIKTYT